MASSRTALGITLMLYLHCSTASWSPWSKCTVSCGDGQRVRSRVCEALELGCTAGKMIKETKDCSSTPCGPLSCYVGLSSSTGDLDVVNNFKLTKCTDAPRTKDKSGRTGLQCALATFKINHGGFVVDMMQGACFSDDQCEQMGCDDYKKNMGGYKIDSCEVTCCPKDGCNNPANFKPSPPPTGGRCSPNPCKNGGSCFASGDGYICSCKHGFQGKDCAAGATRICYTGISVREKMSPSGSKMLPTSCAAADDSCMIATVGAHENAETIYVDTAQCVKPSVCQALTCDDLKGSMPKYNIKTCKIMCCDDDECNQAPVDVPPITTTAYPKPTTKKPAPTRKPTQKPKKPKTTAKPRTKKPKTSKPTQDPFQPTTASQIQPTTYSTPSPTGIHWSEWQPWQSCTHRCGPDGTRQRFRFCVNGGPGQPGCTPATGMLDKEPCNTAMSCVRWREWNQWQSCSRTCGGGTQERRRSCDGGPPNTPGCMGPEIETQNCNEQSCDTTTQQPQTQPTQTPQTTRQQQRGPKWGNYGPWGVCSKTCGKGIMLRSRECIGGKPGKRGCRGSKVEKAECDAGRCDYTTQATTRATVAISGPIWSDWSDWETCSAACGPGTTSRSRVCIGAKRRRKCKGPKSEKRTCAIKACEVVTVDTPEVTCLERNVRVARRKGRRCPLACSSNAECDSGKKCVCDGLCGKTCQDTTKRCTNILASSPEGTVRSCSNGIYVGSKCSYSCHDGYKLEGESVIFCQGTSKWTNQKSLPRCTATTKSVSPPAQSCKFKLGIHDSCCGSVSYSSKKSRCCNGKARAAGPAMTECCGTTPYDPSKKGCCGTRLFTTSTRKCRGGRIVKL